MDSIQYLYYFSSDELYLLETKRLGLPTQASMSDIYKWLIFFKKDDKFKKPKGKVVVKIYTNDLHFGTTAISRVFAEIWKGCFNEYIREFKYIADCAELHLSITLAVDNVQFEWSGYTDTLSVYVEETLQRVGKMKEANLEAIFNQVKEQTLQEMKNFYLN